MDESLSLPLDGTLIHHRLAPSRRWYSFTYPGRTAELVKAEKKDTQIFKSWQSRDPELGAFGSESRDLTTAPIMPAHVVA